VDKQQRQVGKVMELALAYEGGVGAFLTFAAVYGIDLDAMADEAWDSIPSHIKREAADYLAWRVSQGLGQYGLSDETFVVCDSFKRMWREAHPAISSYWKELESAAIQAVLRPGVTVVARKLKFRRDGGWLRMVLPSGRAVCYASPKVEGGKLSYRGVNQYTRKWSRLKTYGGKLFENACQAVARDVMAENMPAIEDAGYELLLTVHDEDITETPDSPDYSAEGLSALMATNPPWALGLPLAAGGFEAYRYRKG
jgi:DNA polymerase